MTGILLVNLGTPDDPGKKSVRRYLAEFLMDPRVIDIPALKRWMVVNLAILPRRPAASAHAYQKIWTNRGSPLLFHAEDLKKALQKKIGEACRVKIAMRYQNPTINTAMDEFRAEGIDRIVVFPLFAQYSSAAFGSAVEAVYRAAASRWNTPFLTMVPPYYHHPAFIRAFTEVAQPHLSTFKPDHVLMSYHGLPQRRVKKSDESETGHCLSAGCCDSISKGNRNCYPAQCYQSSRLIAAALGLDADTYSVSFQSRLGRDPWVRPYTDETVVELAQKGVKRLAMLSASFTADCLETLEELGMGLREEFLAHGGEEFLLVPTLNATAPWVEAVEQILAEAGAFAADRTFTSEPEMLLAGGK